MSAIKRIRKNIIKNMVSNENPCGLCKYIKHTNGEYTGRCLLKDKTVGVANFELRRAVHESCFILREEDDE